MAKDAYHETVERALIKNGWTITRDFFIVRIKELEVEIDFVVTKDDENIAIDVCFFDETFEFENYTKYLVEIRCDK